MADQALIQYGKGKVAKDISDMRVRMYNLVAPRSEIDVRDYGAIGNGTTDDTAAIQAAITAACGVGVGPIEVKLSKGNYKITDELLIDSNRVHLSGSGRKSTIINFMPTSNNKAAVKFQLSSADYIVQCGIRDLSIVSSDTTYYKVGLHLVDVSEFSLDNVSINEMIDSEGGSTGLYWQGRDTSGLNNLHIYADTPLHIGQNPNASAVDIDLDCTNFSNTYFIATGSHANVLIDDGVNVTNSSFTGANIWANGGHGLYYSTSTNVVTNFGLYIENLRWEDVLDSTGYIVYIENNVNQRGVTLVNVYGGHEGFYFRGCPGVTMINCSYAGTPTQVLDIDATSVPVTLIDFYAPTGSTYSVGTLQPHHMIYGDTRTIKHAVYIAPTDYQWLAFANGDATPDVTMGEVFATANSSSTTITGIDGGYEGKRVIIIFNDANTTVDFTGTALYADAIDWSPIQYSWMECVKYGAVWLCAKHDSVY